MPNQPRTNSAPLHTGGHRNNFHLLRLIFSIMVVYSHSWGLLTLPEPTVAGMTMGRFAVLSFFALSGYLIAQSWTRSTGFVSFWQKRCLRLIPALICAEIFAFSISGALGDFATNPVPYISNGPVWTLPWEAFCYFICSLLGLFALMRFSVVGAFYATGLLWFTIALPSMDKDAFVLAPMLLAFLGGSFLSLNEDAFDMRRLGPLACLVMAIAIFDPEATLLKAATGWIPLLYAPKLTPPLVQVTALILALPAAIVYLGLYIKPVWSLRNDFSYGMYIYAWPVQQTIVYYGLQWQLSLPPLMVFAGSVTVTFCLATLSWFIVEKPALKLKGVSLPAGWGWIVARSTGAKT